MGLDAVAELTVLRGNQTWAQDAANGHEVTGKSLEERKCIEITM